MLVGRGLVTDAQIEAAMARQRIAGGRLGENLIALGDITGEQLDSVINSAPATPAGLSETGRRNDQLSNQNCELLSHVCVCARGEHRSLSMAGVFREPALRRAGRSPLVIAVHYRQKGARFTRTRR
jgi:hypothetical protein